MLPFYRYYRSETHDHFYTTISEEIGTTVSGVIGKHGYKSEGLMGYLLTSQEPGTVVLYRYYNSQASDHFYTTNENEIGTITPGQTKKGYTSEGVAGYCYSTHVYSSVSLYQYWNSKFRDHFYTVNENEIGTVVPNKVGKFGYVYEGIQCFILSNFTKLECS